MKLWNFVKVKNILHNIWFKYYVLLIIYVYRFGIKTFYDLLMILVYIKIQAIEFLY
jgi:hypothetical protein